MQTTQNLYEIWFFHQKHKFRIGFELWTIKNQLVFLVFLAKTQISYRFWRIDPPRTWNTLKFSIWNLRNTIYIAKINIFRFADPPENQMRFKTKKNANGKRILIRINKKKCKAALFNFCWFSINTKIGFCIYIYIAFPHFPSLNLRVFQVLGGSILQNLYEICVFLKKIKKT